MLWQTRGALLRNDNIINWYRVRRWFFQGAFAQREGLSKTHRCKRWICCLQEGEMKINDDDSLFGIAVLFKQKREALLPPLGVLFCPLNGLCDGDPSGSGNYDNLRNCPQLSVLSSHLLDVRVNWFYHPRIDLNIIKRLEISGFISLVFMSCDFSVLRL